MKWILLFWVCSAKCVEIPFKKGEFESIMSRQQRVLIFDSITEASLAQRRLLYGMKLNEFDISENSVICSDVLLYKITKETGGEQK